MRNACLSQLRSSLIFIMFCFFSNFWVIDDGKVRTKIFWLLEADRN